MIAYELAQSLKDAGFPQRKGVPKYATDYIGMFVPSVGDVTIPTLSELIEACGTPLTLTYQDGYKEGPWIAGRGLDEDGKVEDAVRDFTPETAIANLWLELHK